MIVSKSAASVPNSWNHFGIRRGRVRTENIFHAAYEDENFGDILYLLDCVDCKIHWGGCEPVGVVTVWGCDGLADVDAVILLGVIYILVKA